MLSVHETHLSGLPLSPVSLSSVSRLKWQGHGVAPAGKCFGFRCRDETLPLAKAGGDPRVALQERSRRGCSPLPGEEQAGAPQWALLMAHGQHPSLVVLWVRAFPFLHAGSERAAQAAHLHTVCADTTQQKGEGVEREGCMAR